MSSDRDARKEMFCVPFRFIQKSLICPYDFINPEMLSEEDREKMDILEISASVTCGHDCKKCWKKLKKCC